MSEEVYCIEDVKRQDNLVKATVLLNASHDVFRGHFPGNPILPGVFIIQILKKIVSDISGKKLLVSKVDSIKYLAFINPKSIKSLIFETVINSEFENTIKFNCNVNSEDTVFCRIKGEMSVTG